MALRAVFSELLCSLAIRLTLACTEEQAQYIQCNDNMYRALWMVPVNNDKISYETLDVIMSKKRNMTFSMRQLSLEKMLLSNQRKHRKSRMKSFLILIRKLRLIM